MENRNETQKDSHSIKILREKKAKLINKKKNKINGRIQNRNMKEN